MKENKAVLLLLAASLIWGFTFAFQSQAADAIGPFMYNGIRMCIGFIVLLPLLLKILKGKDKAYIKSLLFHSFICGLLIGSASIVQQIGIKYTTAGKAGFITSLYTLIVPILSLLVGKKVSRRIWVCVFGGLVGAFLLSINNEGGIGKGDIIIFVCAILFALHIMYIDKVGKAFNGVDLSAFQFLTAGIICLIIGSFVETTTLSNIKAALIPILYAGIGSCGIAYTLQVVGQKYVQPAKATLALSLESAWSVVGGAIILGETMSPRELFGCLILFVALVIAQLPEKKKA